MQDIFRFDPKPHDRLEDKEQDGGDDRRIQAGSDDASQLNKHLARVAGDQTGGSDRGKDTGQNSAKSATDTVHAESVDIATVRHRYIVERD